MDARGRVFAKEHSRSKTFPVNGLPPAPKLSRSNDLPLRLYEGNVASDPDSLARPSGTPIKSGTLRVPGGVAPVLPGDNRSPFRFLEADKDASQTPIDVSPLTPLTPRLLHDAEQQTLVVGSTGSSPNLATPGYLGFSEDDAAGKQLDHLGLGSYKRLPSEKIAANNNFSRSPPSNKRSLLRRLSDDESSEGTQEPSVASFAETRSEVPRSTASHHITSPHDHSLREARRDDSQLNDIARDVPHGYIRQPSGGEQLSEVPAATVIGPTKESWSFLKRPLAQHIRSHSTASAASATSVSHQDRQQSDISDFQIAAAQAAAIKKQRMLEQQDAGWPASENQQQEALVGSRSARSPSPSSHRGRPRDGAITESIDSNDKARTRQAEVARPRITPTPQPPAIVRLGSRLKTEVKGVFSRKPERSRSAAEKPEKSERPARPEAFEQVQAKHWTDLDY